MRFIPYGIYTGLVELMHTLAGLVRATHRCGTPTCAVGALLYPAPYPLPLPYPVPRRHRGCAGRRLVLGRTLCWIMYCTAGAHERKHPGGAGVSHVLDLRVWCLPLSDGAFRGILSPSRTRRRTALVWEHAGAVRRVVYSSRLSFSAALGATLLPPGAANLFRPLRHPALDREPSGSNTIIVLWSTNRS